MKNKMKLPTTLGKYLKKYKRQRAHRCLSDYDLMDLHDNLMELIPAAIERLQDIRSTYSESLWMFDTKELRTNLTAEEYEAEVRDVIAQFRRAIDMELDGKLDQATELRLRCFEWLAYNIPTLWT